MKVRIFEKCVKVRNFENTEFLKKYVFLKNLTIFKTTKKEWSRSLPSLFINMFFWLNKILQGLKMASQTLQTIRNGWAPEIKRLNDNLEKLEASLSGTDECVLDIYSLEETLQDKIHLLDAELTTVKADIADLKDHLTSVNKELECITGGGIEDELFAVKTENIEMRSHFNSMIKQLNEVTAFVNQKYGYRIIEETAEFDWGTTPPPNSPRDKKYNLRSHVIDME